MTLFHLFCLFAFTAIGLLMVGCDGQPRGGDLQQEAVRQPPVDAQFTGRCHCGKIRYAVTGPVVKTSTCDCTGCRRATGTLAAPFVTVKGDDLRVTAGEPKTYLAVGGEKCDKHGSWYFCGDCGSPLYWADNLRKQQVDLFAGSLDDPSIFQARQ